MTIIDNPMLWRQFAVAIDSFGDALRKPDQWVAKGFSAFWYLGYHTLFWLDLYLTGAEEGFAPPEPFNLVEMEADEILPRVYSREELLGYLDICRQRCQETIISMPVEQAYHICSFPWGEVPFAELMLYTMRHVQEHAAQLHLFLGQHGVREAG